MVSRNVQHSVCELYCLLRPYSKPEGRRSESGAETGGTESGMMGSGLRKGVRQRSFFEDEYSTVTGEVGGAIGNCDVVQVVIWQ